MCIIAEASNTNISGVIDINVMKREQMWLLHRTLGILLELFMCLCTGHMHMCGKI